MHRVIGWLLQPIGGFSRGSLCLYALVSTCGVNTSALCKLSEPIFRRRSLQASSFLFGLDCCDNLLVAFYKRTPGTNFQYFPPPFWTAQPHSLPTTSPLREMMLLRGVLLASFGSSPFALQNFPDPTQSSHPEIALFDVVQPKFALRSLSFAWKVPLAIGYGCYKLLYAIRLTTQYQKATSSGPSCTYIQQPWTVFMSGSSLDNHVLWPGITAPPPVACITKCKSSGVKKEPRCHYVTRHPHT